MENFESRLTGMLDFMELYGADGFDDSKIEELEAIILECNSIHKNEYTNDVADSIYDALYEMLKVVNPQSRVLCEIWEDEVNPDQSYTDLLKANPMMSIETAKSYTCSALENWIDRMPEEETNYFISFKINGHGVRVVYDDGELVSATSRARSSAGRDITRQMKIILGEHNPSLEGFGVVELRGEVCLPLCRMDAARSFNPSIKSAFSAVSSLIRPSAPAEEVSLLDFLCYGFLSEGFVFETREEEFQCIEESGYSVPQYMCVEGIGRSGLLDCIEQLMGALEEDYEEFGYFCDGAVMEPDSREYFHSLGSDGNHNLGNIALKVGLWKQDVYVGFVQDIIWTKGKSKVSPVAIVSSEPGIAEFDEDGNIINMEDLGVLTVQGNKVRRVPLYEPKNIIIFDAYKGNIICFRYGGEAGVVPCFENGVMLSEDAAKELIENN